SDDTAATWGYSRATDGDDLARRYAALLTGVRKVRIFSGFCYTQFTDTYQEANGLVTMDRKPKFDVELIAIATRGPANPTEAKRLQSLLTDPQ
ncbi:MAG: glycoside hydrolase family 2, partial [Tepidisphaeraceae bacterium]